MGDELFAAARDLARRRGFGSPCSCPTAYMFSTCSKTRVRFHSSFVAARTQVLSDYRNQSVDRLKSSGESFLRKRANVLIADDLR